MNKALIRELKNSSTIAISGHERPDGDCVGAVLALYNYIRECYPEKMVDLYLQPIRESFRFLKNSDQIISTIDKEQEYDLFISCDCGDTDRLTEFVKYYQTAKRTICIDHHISNSGFGLVRFIVPEMSSTCELLYDLLDEERISDAVATALYMGMVHDTGVFKHQNTTRATMETAGKLIEKGINTSYIIDETFYAKSYMQNQILGRALLESILFLDGKGIFAYINLKTLAFYGATGSDLDGIIDQLRVTKGIETAVLVYDITERDMKVSMRSNGIVDVSRIAKLFGGGGHVRAAGFSMNGTVYDVINNIAQQMEQQLKAENSSV